MKPSPTLDLDALLELPPAEKQALVTALNHSLGVSTGSATAPGETGRSLLETANSASGIGFSTWNLRDGKVVFDESYHALLGVELGDLPTGADLQQARIHPDDRERVVAARQACLRGERARYESLHRERHADGRWLWLREQGTLVGTESATGAEVMVRTHFDVTRFKMLAAEARRSRSST